MTKGVDKCRYEMVPLALRALEALGPALEAHLQLLLPALVRLICPGASVYTLTRHS